MKEIDYNQPFELLPNRVWRTYRGGAMVDAIEGKEGEDGHFPEDWVGSATRAANMGRKKFADEGVGRAGWVAQNIRWKKCIRAIP